MKKYLEIIKPAVLGWLVSKLAKPEEPPADADTLLRQLMQHTHRMTAQTLQAQGQVVELLKQQLQQADARNSMLEGQVRRGINERENLIERLNEARAQVQKLQNSSKSLGRKA